MIVTWWSLALVALGIFGVVRMAIGMIAYFAGYMKPVPDRGLAASGCFGVTIGLIALIAAIYGLAS